MYWGTPLTSLTSEAAPYDTISRHTAPDPMATLPPASEPSLRERFQGCLLAGAIGDALGGAPVEFMSWREIERRFGPNGIRTFASAYGGEGMITDDSQMTLFTAEGLIRAQHRMADRGLANVDAVIHRAYLRWLYTQIGDRRRGPLGFRGRGGHLGLAGGAELPPRSAGTGANLHGRTPQRENWNPRHAPERLQGLRRGYAGRARSAWLPQTLSTSAAGLLRSRMGIRPVGLPQGPSPRSSRTWSTASPFAPLWTPLLVAAERLQAAGRSSSLSMSPWRWWTRARRLPLSGSNSSAEAGWPRKRWRSPSTPRSVPRAPPRPWPTQSTMEVTATARGASRATSWVQHWAWIGWSAELLGELEGRSVDRAACGQPLRHIHPKA